MDLNQTFQRFEISPNSVNNNNNKTTSNNTEEQEQDTHEHDTTAVIPILQRSLDAKSQNQKLRNVSPICVIVVGMAGSGKTTLMAALQRSLAVPVDDDTTNTNNNNNNNSQDQQEGQQEQQEQEQETLEHNHHDSKKPIGYCINLDPATKLVPFGASIDIRDTVDYKEVMKQHRLGPNGAIMTSLNLFSTKFDQVLGILEKRAFSSSPTTKTNTTNVASTLPNQTNIHNQKQLDYILVDTPGQIEAFTWSASGSIITSSLSSSFPTILAFVVDTPRCVASLNTFMSNMLYACSMFYRTRLPLIVVFNKCDVVSADVPMEWMSDYESFQEALDDFTSSDASGYYASLTRSLSLVLDEFYRLLKKVGVSAATGDGVEEFWMVVDRAAEEFEEDYVGDLKCRVEEQQARKRAIARDGLKRLKKDLDSADR